MNILNFVILLISCFFPIFQLNSAARILVVVPTPSYSHQNAFYPLWTELSLRGHDVTLITTDVINNSSLINLTEIDVHDVTYEAWNKKLQGILETSSQSMYSLLNIFFDLHLHVIDKILDHPKVKAIITNETEHFDLLIAEGSSDVVYAFAKRFKCPFIMVTSFDGVSYYYRQIGSPSHPITNPDMFIAYNDILNFKERLTSVTIELLYNFFVYFYRGLTESIVREHFGLGYTDIATFGKNASMLFLNSNPIFFRVRPLAPNVIQFGGATHIKPAQPLPEKLKSFLDSAKEGFVYFSLGSNVKSKDLSPEMIKTLTESFSKVPYKILWKFEVNQFDNLPKNVLIYKWIPQRDVLCHPNIKLFITQGGLQSLEESLYCQVPILGLPFFADQPANIKLAVNKGIGLSADPFSLTRENFQYIIMEVIGNPKYRNKDKQLSNLIYDQPMTGLQRAIWWTEYVIRHKGAVHFKSPALDIPFYQYYLLDVIAFYIAIAVMLIYIPFKVFSLLYHLCRIIFKRNSKLKSQ